MTTTFPVVPVQEPGMCSRVFNSIGDGISKAGDVLAQGASWAGRQIVMIGSQVKGFARSVVEWATPYFNQFSTFVGDHQKEIGIASIALAIGVVGTAMISSIFCNRAAQSRHPANGTSTGVQV
jgi:hypothetical protein